MSLHEIKAITSAITLIEVLVQPIKQNNVELENRYLDILINNANLDLISIDAAISQRAARIRGKYDLKTPDAIQLACGIICNCDTFLTHDKSLKKVKEIQVVTLNELF